MVWGRAKASLLASKGIERATHSWRHEEHTSHPLGYSTRRSVGTTLTNTGLLHSSKTSRRGGLPLLLLPAPYVPGHNIGATVPKCAARTYDRSNSTNQTDARRGRRDRGKRSSHTRGYAEATLLDDIAYGGTPPALTSNPTG